MLLEKSVNVLNLGARTRRDSLLPRAINTIGVAPLSWRHRAYNCFHLTKRVGLKLFLSHLGHIAHTGQLVHHTGNTPHIIHLLYLVAKVFEVELLAFLEFGSKFLRFLFINFLLCVLNQREHITHTQNP